VMRHIMKVWSQTVLSILSRVSQEFVSWKLLARED